MSEKEEKMESCFIITPIGSDKSDIRRHADGVIKSVIRPLLKERLDFKEVVAAHEISKSGSINNQVMNNVIDSDLVIVNLSGLNPNVMYELAVRHTTQKPIIHICEKDTTNLPFDIIDQRTIFYTDDMLGVQELSDQLTKMILNIKKNTIFDDNPIYNSKRQQSIYKELESEVGEKDVLKYIMSRMDSLSEKIDNNSIKNNSYTTSYDMKYRYIEEFEFAVSVIPIVFERDIFVTKLKSKVMSVYTALLDVRFIKQENDKNNFYEYYSITIGSNKDVPIKEAVKKLVESIAKNEITVTEIQGNEIPF